MGKILFTNNATSFLSTAASPADTFITIDAGSETLFPSIVTAGDYFMITVVTPTGELEIMQVTETNGNILTVVRGQEDTTALALPVKSLVENRLTAGSLENNLNNLPDATIAQEGVIRIATDAEAVAGTLENVATTPKHMSFKYDKTGGSVSGTVTASGFTLRRQTGSNTLSTLFYNNEQNGRSHEAIWTVDGALTIGGFASNSASYPDEGGVYTQRAGWTHPAPLPQNYSGKGQVTLWSNTLPTGGSWLILAVRVNALDYRLILDYVGSVFAGGTDIKSKLSGYNSDISGVAWRIA